MADAPSWLRYSNAKAKRNDPLAPELINAMSFLGELGITMDVISGGQEDNGPNGTGSTRHNHGNAADVDFYKDGRKLDWNNPEDLPLLTTIVKAAKSRGVTGIGAGDDYMGAGRFHVGFGAPGVWGAGGKGANAPEWLRAAYNGAAAATAATGQPHSVNDGHDHSAFIPQPDYAGGAAQGRYQPPGGVVSPQVEKNPLRLEWAYRNGKMTPEDAALYERGKKANFFQMPEAPQADPLAVYAQTVAPYYPGLRRQS